MQYLALPVHSTQIQFQRHVSNSIRTIQGQAKNPYTQISEPIIIPMLHIFVADFPLLHLSMDQRMLTFETWCGYKYVQVRT